MRARSDGRVEIEAHHVAEAREQRRGEQPGARGGADQREGGDGQLVGRGVGAVAGDDVDLEVLHRGVEALFDRGGEPVDLVDEEHVVGLQLGKQARRARPCARWPGPEVV